MDGEELEDPDNQAALIEYQPPGSDFTQMLFNLMGNNHQTTTTDWGAPPSMDGLSLGNTMGAGPSTMMDTSGMPSSSYAPLVTPPMYPVAPVPVSVTVVPQEVDGAAPPVPDMVSIPPASGAMPTMYMGGADAVPGVFSGGLQSSAVQPVVQSPIDLDDLGLTPDLMASLSGGDGVAMGDGMDDAMWQSLMESADSLGTSGLISPLIKSEPKD